MKLTLLLGIFLCVAVAGPGSAQTDRFPISVMVTTTADAAPFFYARRQGLFAKAGLDVTATIVRSGSIATQAVIGGSAQIAQTNVFTVVLAHAHGIPLILIAPGGQNNPASPNLELFVARNSPIKTAKDLEGRTLGVTSLHDQQSLGARALIEAAGGDLTKVKFLELPQSAMLDAVVAGRVDGFIAYEPFRSADEASGEVRSIGAPFDAISKQPMIYTAWSALRPWVEQNRVAVGRFAGVMRAASAYTNAHYDEVMPLMAATAKIPLESLQKMHRPRDATELSPSDVQPVIDAAAHFKEISAPFPAQDIVASF